MQTVVFRLIIIVLLVAGVTQTLLAVSSAPVVAVKSLVMSGSLGENTTNDGSGNSNSHGQMKMLQVPALSAWIPFFGLTQTPLPSITPLSMTTPSQTWTTLSTATQRPTDTSLPTVTSTSWPTDTLAETTSSTPASIPQPIDTPIPSTTPQPINASEDPVFPITDGTRQPTGDPTQSDAIAPTSTLQRTEVPTETASPLPTDTEIPTSTPVEEPGPGVPPSGIRVMRVEYDDYGDSRDEVAAWEQKMTAAEINMVALAAGRLEWTYFKWVGHESDWSSAVRDTGADILAADSADYGRWASINAVIDVYAPNYIRDHPEKAAVNALGEPSPNLVSTAELVDGEFGQKLLEMVDYIAANYQEVDSISITELSYRIDGYGADDLALYAAATGQSDWPRQSDGRIDIDDPSIGDWRSALLGEFLGRAAAIAHQYGKQLFMDVGVSADNLSLMTNNKGTNYSTMLQYVDKIVVWDYFGEDGFPPEYSRDIAEFLTQFGTERVILSVGLWGANGTTVSAGDLITAIEASMEGGMPNIWITPGSMMSADHWQALEAFWGNG